MFRLSHAKLLSAHYVMVAVFVAAAPRLAAFVESARSASFDNREARATAAQRHDELAQAWLKLVPTAQASAAYTNNQYEASVSIPTMGTIVITPQNQYDFIFSATAPIVDVGAWQRIGVARRNEEAGRARAGATSLDVQRNVAQAYYQVVAAEAVLDSANKRRDTAQANLDFVQTRHDAGVATDLDYKRSQSELDRTKQDIADAQYSVRIARRSLATVSGRDASPGGAELPDDLADEAPLSSWTVDASALPAVRASHADALSAEESARATRDALWPTISATATERVTNAAGFGQSPYYTVGVVATWRFDASVIAGGAAGDQAAAAAHVREDKARRLAEDDIYNSYQAVIRGIEKARAAKTEREASDLAAGIARQRYEAGTATYLDLLTAERDDFTARVSYIQAVADLSYARVALRIAAGRSLSRVPS
jgi:outer membrane protein TolC